MNKVINDIMQNSDFLHMNQNARLRQVERETGDKSIRHRIMGINDKKLTFSPTIPFATSHPFKFGKRLGLCAYRC